MGCLTFFTALALLLVIQCTTVRSRRRCYYPQKYGNIILRDLWSLRFVILCRKIVTYLPQELLIINEPSCNPLDKERHIIQNQMCSLLKLFTNSTPQNGPKHLGKLTWFKHIDITREKTYKL